jgi:UDP-N-acetylglucosamine--N-acetylmuramyl-(pentapeptide) pyrophosphoryl-undecaprenol N-acetylglucosamine transferase
MILAGGTGGHVYPALAVAEELRDAGVGISWLGSRVGLENRIVPRASIALHRVWVRGLRGGSLLRRLTAPLMLMVALFQSLIIILRVRPHAVLGMGGFVAGPGAVAARVLGIPLLIHEQNALIGMTNRWLHRWCQCAMEAFPGTFERSLYPAVPVHTTGNPLRREIAAANARRERTARSDRIEVLVLGGSQGARALNTRLPPVLLAIAEEQPLHVVHQCGNGNATQTQSIYGARSATIDVVEFIDDMADALAAADVVVARAGAMTVAEVSAVGVATVFVPFPFAVDDHQTKNAAYLTEQGAALLVPEGDDFEIAMLRALKSLVSDRDAIAAFSTRAHELGRPDAARRVADLCSQYLGGAS